MDDEVANAGKTSRANFPWLAAYPAGVPARIETPPYNVLGEIAPDLAARRPAARAFTTIMPNGLAASLSFAQVDRYSDAFAAYLRETLHLEPGARVAIQIPNGLAYPVADEPFIALDLQSLVEEQGHRVVNVARTHREAVAAVKRERPGLILADIQLADGSSGLEAVNQILETFSVPVIFITAYPERFLTGTPPEPAFLITKPFGIDSLKAVISQALFFDRKSHRAVLCGAPGAWT
jgi:CheY-like chemotaxis protein